MGSRRLSNLLWHLFLSAAFAGASLHAQPVRAGLIGTEDVAAVTKALETMSYRGMSYRGGGGGVPGGGGGGGEAGRRVSKRPASGTWCPFAYMHCWKPIS